MSLWGKIKKAVKKVVHVVKSVVRQVVKVVIEAISRFSFGLPDLLLGFIGHPRKKLRLYVAILSDENGVPLLAPGDLTPAVNAIVKIFKDGFNVKVVPYSKGFVETITVAAPTDALEVSSDIHAWGEEFGEAGNFFAKHVAGWNAIPISLTFPVTVFIVRSVADVNGCSLGPLTDYVTLDLDGVKDTSLMAHEVGHSCGLWHSGSKSNIMHAPSNRGNSTKWFQKNILRSSRHVLYW